MLADARELREGAILRTDVCIIGAGPAGLALAGELEAAQLRVCLLESGTTAGGSETPSTLPLVELPGDIQPDARTRGHGFGGTAHRWNFPLPGQRVGVGYGRLRDIDFEEREWVPHSGWPFSGEVLDGYYGRALAAVGIPVQRGCGDGCSERVAGALPLDGAGWLTTTLAIGDPSRFTHAYRAAFRRSSRITVLCHATALRLEQRPSSSSIERVQAGCTNGRQFSVEAAAFVLACGAVENARLLLLSNDGAPDGIGNAHDFVGRYFTDHLFVQAGSIVPASRALFDRVTAYSLRQEDRTLVQTKLMPSDGVLRRHWLLASAAVLTPKPPPEQQAGIQAGKRLYRAVRDRRPEALLSSLRDALPAATYFATTGLELAIRQRRLLPSMHAGWADLRLRGRRFSTFGVELQIELAPDPDNRVLLTNHRDPWGRPVAGVQWRWTELDRHTLAHTGRLLDHALRRAGLGHFEPHDGHSVYEREGAHHHMGTTRMSAHPAHGVVDPDLRVHDVDNLFVVGGSVFPTGGHVNPTLTIVALAIRLADHICERLLCPAAVPASATLKDAHAYRAEPRARSGLLQ